MQSTAPDPAARAGAVLDIDLDAIVANWRQLAKIATPAQCAAVVKANAYGLGVAPVARALAAAGCRLFFVATLDEGIALRQALCAGPEIAVLNGPPPRTAGEFVEHTLIPVLNEPGQIAEWKKISLSALQGGEGRGPLRSGGKGEVGARAKTGSRPGIPHLTPTLSAPRGGEGAILQIDTGMSRLGLSPQDFAALIDTAPPIGWRAVMSHLACADELSHQQNDTQRARFADAVAHLPGIPASLAASSGIFLGPAYHFDLVRPGAALYGVNPQPNRPNPLRPVVRLTAKILQIRQIDRGEAVGYGAAHVMQGPGRVATVPVGYADGWLRSLGGRGCGTIAGTRVPLLGRVSMDLATFDVSAVPDRLLHPGATIELLGPHYGVDDAAADAGTIGYEILTALGNRYYRVYRGGCAG